MAKYVDCEKAIEMFNRYFHNLQGYEAQILVCDMKQAFLELPTADVVEVVRCKDCLYFECKSGSYGTCEHWHTNSQDIFDLNYCGYAEPRTPKKEVEKSENTRQIFFNVSESKSILEWKYKSTLFAFCGLRH